MERVKQVAQTCGAAPAQVSIAWLLRQPTVTPVILGATHLEHLEEALKALDLKLDSSTIAALDAIAPV